MYPLVSGIGMGLLFHAPYQVFVRCLKPGELAAGTSAFFLVRFTGATVGLVCTRSAGRVECSDHVLSGRVGSYTIRARFPPLAYRGQLGSCGFFGRTQFLSIANTAAQGFGCIRHFDSGTFVYSKSRCRLTEP